MAEWIEKTKELPPLEVAVWAYYSNEPWSSVRRVWRGGMMMYEEDEGQWKGMGSAGDEYIGRSNLHRVARDLGRRDFPARAKYLVLYQ